MAYKVQAPALEGKVEWLNGLFLYRWTVPGIGSGAAYAANDAVGIMHEIPVPEYGIIQYLRLVDPDDDTLALTAHFFTEPFTAAADNAAFTIGAVDARMWVTSQVFGAGTDIGSAKASEITSAGVFYRAPHKRLYLQGSTTGTPNIASGAYPEITIGILPGVSA